MISLEAACELRVSHPAVGVIVLSQYVDADYALRLIEGADTASRRSLCATLAHRELGLMPPASCRLSFALYTSPDDVERAMKAVRRVIKRARPRYVGRKAAADDIAVTGGSSARFLIQPALDGR